MPIKKSELHSSLWRSCDELRGGMDASQYAALTSLARHRDETRPLKEGMVQELLTGRTRLV